MIARISQWFQRHFSDPQVVILALFLILGLVAVLVFGRMLAPVVASLILAYLLEGGVQRLQRVGLPRLVSVVSVFTTFLAALFFLIFALLPMLTRQLGAIVRDLPEYVGMAQRWLGTLPERYPQFVAPAKSDEAENGESAQAGGGLEPEIAAEEAEDQLALISEEQLSVMLERLGSELESYATALISVSAVTGLVNLLVFLVLMPVLVFFFLKDKHKLVDWFRHYLPRNRGLVTSVWQEVDAQIGNYVRGKVIEIMIVWIVTYLVFTSFGMPFAMLLSMLVGLSVIIPYIGAAVVTLPVALVALVAFGVSASFWYVMIAYVIIQALDGNVLVPILFSEVVNLHPVAIIIAVLVFGGIWGFWGVFFAIPLATLVNAVLRAWPRKLPDDAENGQQADAGA